MYGLGATYGPPVDPNTPIPASGTALDQLRAEVDALWQYTGAGQDGGTPSPIAASVAPSWISGIPNWVVVVVGGAAALVLLKGVAR